MHFMDSPKKITRFDFWKELFIYLFESEGEINFYPLVQSPNNCSCRGCHSQEVGTLPWSPSWAAGT